MLTTFPEEFMDITFSFLAFFAWGSGISFDEEVSAEELDGALDVDATGSLVIIALDVDATGSLVIIIPAILLKWCLDFLM